MWIGSTLGMVAADALAILVGAIAGKHLPERLIQIVAAASFLIFGIFILVDGIFPALPGAVIVVIAVGVVLLLGAALRTMPPRLRPAVMRAEPARADAKSPDTPLDTPNFAFPSTRVGPARDEI